MRGGLPIRQRYLSACKAPGCLPPPTDIAADVGAGTGIFSRQLAAYVGKAYAVEPNDDMRAAMQADVALSPLCGSAESIPLPDCSVDVITAAQAFHWF